MAKDDSFLSSKCEIKSTYNRTLAVGSVSAYDLYSITISSTYDEFPILYYRDLVKVDVLSGTPLSHHVFNGQVYSSTPSELCINELVPLIELDKRESFRLSINMEGVVKYAPKESNSDDAEQSSEEIEEPPSFPVKIIDISSGGALFASSEEFTVLDSLILTIDINTRKLDLPFYVVHTTRVPEAHMRRFGFAKYQYGCKFNNLNRRTSDFLLTYLFQEQARQLKKVQQRDF